MNKQEKILEGIEIILFANSVKGKQFQKDFTELAKDIVRMEASRGVVIKVEKEETVSLPFSGLGFQVDTVIPVSSSKLNKAGYATFESLARRDKEEEG